MGDSNGPLAQLPDTLSKDGVDTSMMEISGEPRTQGSEAQSQTDSETDEDLESKDPEFDCCRKDICPCEQCTSKIWFCKACPCQSCSNMRIVKQYLPHVCREKIKRFCRYCTCKDCKERTVWCAECTCRSCDQDRVRSGTDDRSGEYAGTDPMTPNDRKRKAASELLPARKLYFTPQKNAKAGSSVPMGGKRKTADKTVLTNQGVTLDPRTKNICIITQKHSAHEDLEFCHVIPQEFKGSEIMIRRLEMAWGVPERTLNIDTSDNLICLTPDMHTAFDKPRWAFMPAEPEIVQRLSDFTFGNGSKDIVDIRDIYASENRTSFSYILVPFENFTTIIIRWTRGPSGVLETKNYPPPYSNFPLVWSHVHPHYVIYNLMHKLAEDKKLAAFVRTWLEDHQEDLVPSLSKCRKIFEKWESTPTGLFRRQSPTRVGQQDLNANSAQDPLAQVAGPSRLT